MGAIEDVYSDLDTDVSLEEFEDAVEAKVEQMGGLADEETAAMLIAHELRDEEVTGISDIEPGMDEVKFLAKVTGVGELRTFERDEEDEDGMVINVEAADATGSVRLAFWDEQAKAIENEGMEQGTVLRVKGRPKEGYNGLEVSVTQAEEDPDAEVDVDIRDTYRIEDLSMGLSDVDLKGKVLATDGVRTFDRDDGSEGRVANLTLGDETGRIRITLWDERTEATEAFSAGESVEIVDGYVRERNGELELHVGNRGAIEGIEDEIEYVPETTAIEDLAIEDVADIGGVVRSADPKRTFDRDDGSEGQVRNVRIQDETGDIRVAMWGEKADIEMGPGDTVQFADVEIQDGWQDDIEASAGWRATVTVTDSGSSAPTAGGGDSDSAELSSFGDDGSAAGTAESAGSENASGSAESVDSETGPSAGDGDAETVEFTGTVVQPGDPAKLDDGTETVSVHTSEELSLGEEVTVRGPMREGRIDAEDVV
ncbi:single-stranded DNA binding protein [Halalkalicoccus jeotgali]|uniref:Replication factor A n=1 Tax=Halalkalicoccus jeotgali (strain DSM 18796 / CECT 7217 / JCM 14584 / KCTC 4019 / B3) TaxID=795797 RepID=D8J954_HALJB|nr:single-stranded DNA binding protein [Halalkalicoccus jeotgali]ADJ16323.1 replication factor A [Halalkalicoccus jeotgali B3]ELY37058.1 replication factor A [Halalkalicoccus jeotgali B3]